MRFHVVCNRVARGIMETGIRHCDRHSLFLWLPRRDRRQVPSVLSALETPRLSGRQSQSSGPRSDDHHERPESRLVPLPQPTGGARAALVVLVPAPLALPAAVRPRPAGGRPSCHITLSIRYDRWRLLSSWVVRWYINRVGQEHWLRKEEPIGEEELAAEQGVKKWIPKT